MTPVLTVFTASARLDLARLWLACVERALVGESAAIEIFGESDSVLDPSLLPGATILRPAPSRRDYQEALNDALRRVTTPYLAFIDTDVFWTSGETWPRVKKRLEDDGCAAVSCVSRTGTEGHGTFAVILKVAPYRKALTDVPGGFFAAAVREETDEPPGRWFGHDTGDLLLRAVVAQGGRVDLLHLDVEGAFVKFDALTCTHLLAKWAGGRPVLALARGNGYLRDSILGNLALAGVHRRLFPEGPPFEFGVSKAALWASLARRRSRLREALGRARRIGAGARRVERFIRD